MSPLPPVSKVQREKVRAMAAEGVPAALIRLLLAPTAQRPEPLTPRQFLRLFKAELATGEAEADAAVARAMHQLACNGKNATLTLAWARHRLGWPTGPAEGDPALLLSTETSLENFSRFQKMLAEVATRKSVAAEPSAALAAHSAAQPATAAGG